MIGSGHRVHIDDSGWWVKNEDDIRKVTDVIGAAVAKTLAPFIGTIIKAIPEVVDFFKGLDEGDEVSRCAADMPLDAPGPGQSRTKVLEPRTRGSRTVSGLSISNWNYSVEFAVIGQVRTRRSALGSDVPHLGAAQRLDAAGGDKGAWESESRALTYLVERSQGAPWPIDVTLKEALPTGTVETKTERVSISGLNVEIAGASATSTFSSAASAPSVMPHWLMGDTRCCYQGRRWSVPSLSACRRHPP